MVPPIATPQAYLRLFYIFSQVCFEERSPGRRFSGKQPWTLPGRLRLLGEEQERQTARKFS